MGEWQPIETAPHGVWLLVWEDYGGFCVIAQKNYGIWTVALPSGYSIVNTPGSVDECRVPTHWMPLPIAPTHEGGEP